MAKNDNPIEKAIAYFEDAIKESDEIINEATPKLQKQLTEQKLHFLTALNALRCVADISRICKEG